MRAVGLGGREAPSPRPSPGGRGRRYSLTFMLEFVIKIVMEIFAPILRGLQAVIAVRAARDRTLTVLLVALCGRIARMGTRLERLVGLWRAGKLPLARAPRAARAAKPGDKLRVKPAYPTAPAWLLRKLGWEVASYGSQLRHLLSEAECAEFLAAVPQAGRILRPLLQMLSVDPLPEVLRKARPSVGVIPSQMPLAKLASVTLLPVPNFSSV